MLLCSHPSLATHIVNHRSHLACCEHSKNQYLTTDEGVVGYCDWYVYDSEYGRAVGGGKKGDLPADAKQRAGKHKTQKAIDAAKKLVGKRGEFGGEIEGTVYAYW